MTLEFEKLTADLEKMAQTTARRLSQRRERVAEALQTLHTYRTNWTAVTQALETAKEQSDPKFYRSARPFSEAEPLDSHFPAPAPPEQATIIAADGSQIMPDRHAAHLYYLINVGGIIYHHGSGQTPETFSQPDIFYPESDETIDSFESTSGQVSIKRDVMEIGALARKSFDYKHTPQPRLAILDQRLLYWPIGSEGLANNDAVTKWGNSMIEIRQTGTLLCGYIDQPGTNVVSTLVHSISGLNDKTFDWKSLGHSRGVNGLTDAHIFEDILQAGERSTVFSFVSKANTIFTEQDYNNEVCFFYVNPGTPGRNFARVDIPRWVAENKEHVAMIHALIIDQSRILGSYPYVLLRAHELAVVGRNDTENLNFLIDRVMQKHDIMFDITSKQRNKNLTTGQKTRHGGVL